MKPPSIVPIIALAIINGIFSPQLVAVFALQGLWYPFFLPASMGLVFALSSLLLSTLFLMLSGVPAALYERLMGNGETNLASRLIWLGAMALLTVPTLPNIMRALGLG
jgi:ABC-type sulfate transport system permease subunit